MNPPAFPIPHPETRVLFRQDPPGTPDSNMAADEALFLSLTPEEPLLLIRFYSWESPTLSLGRFQDPSRILNLEKMKTDSIGFVRRMTGGRCVFHGAGTSELTCAFGLSSAALTPFGKRPAFLFLHDLFIRTLAGLGLTARIAERTEKHRPAGLRADCFDSPSEYELVSDKGEKLMGSAQYADPRGILQQTSIPLDSEVFRISSYELRPAGLTRPPSPLAGTEPQKIISGFLTALRETIPGDKIRPLLPDSGLIRKIRTDRYARDEWNLSAIHPQGVPAP